MVPPPAATTTIAPAATPAHGSTIPVMAAEATGTALLLMAIVGSGTAAARAFPDRPGLALLVNAIATGATLTALILALGNISAAFNPLVSLLARVQRQISTQQALAAIGAQLVGATAGVLVANVMFALPPLTLASTDRASGAAFIGETVATVGLLLLITLTVRAGDPLRVGITVGAYITAAMWFTSSTAFANPAVTLARIGTDTFTGITPGSAAVFLLAQALALPIVYLLARLITRTTH